MVKARLNARPSVPNSHARQRTNRLLAKRNVRTFAEFTGTAEADIEDMFDRQFYLDLVNAEYVAELQKPITLGDLGRHPRILSTSRNI